MKRIKILLASAFIVLMGSITPAESPKVANFTIEIEHLPEGLSLKCRQGCVWQTLTVGGCGSREPCLFVLDQNGMKDPRTPE